MTAALRAIDAAALVCEAAAALEDPPQEPHAWRDAAVIAAVETAWSRGDAGAVRAIADGYGASILRIPVRGPGGVGLAAAGMAERRRRGSFATPPELAAVLAAHALPTLDGACAPVVPRVVDPACGSGALLRAAFARLLAVGVPAREAVGALHGVEADRAALAACRAVLAVDSTEAGYPCSPTELAGRLVAGDALLGPTPRCSAAPAVAAVPANSAGSAVPPDDDGLIWHQAYPAVLDVAGLRPEPVTGWRGGFDAVIANPPWERLKVTGKDWSHQPPSSLRADRAGAARTVREVGRHPLTGAGELNAYLPFAETCWRLLAPGGRAALVVPAGIATDRSAAALLEAWLSEGALSLLHTLQPPKSLFDGVSVRVMVAVVVLRGGPRRDVPLVGEGLPLDGEGQSLDGNGRPATAEVAVGLPDPARSPGGRAWRLDAATPRLVNPNTGTVPLFSSARDARIVTAAHRRWPILRRRDPATGVIVDNPWNLRLVTPFHMTRDAVFFAGAPGPGLLPLWEAKHAALLDHRGGAQSQHRYWIPEELVHSRYGDLTARGWLAGYRNVTTVDSPRTLLPSALPVAGVGNSFPLLSAPRLPLLLAALASLPVDHLVRQKHAGANLNFFKLEQVALPPPSAYDVAAPWDSSTTIAAWVLGRFAHAVAWDDGHLELAGLAAELDGLGIAVPTISASPEATLQRRLLALADLDAAQAVMLGLDRSDLAHLLTTFNALRVREERAFGRFATADRALAAYDRLCGTHA